MGNRAVIVFKETGVRTPHGVYLHWNGGPESVLAFLSEQCRRGWTRSDYASARFVQIVGEFLDQDGDDRGLSLGIVSKPKDYADGCDNGLYEVESREGGFIVRNNKWGWTWDIAKGLLPMFHDPREEAQFYAIRETLRVSREARTKKTQSA